MAAVLAVLNTYPITVSRGLVFESKNSFMQNQAAFISTAVGTSDSLTSENVNQTMSILELGEIDMVVVTDESGTELYRSATRGRYAGEASIERGVGEALDGNDYFHSSFEAGIFKSYSAMPVMNKGERIGAVFIYEYDSAQGGNLIDLQKDIQSLSVALSVLGVLLCLLLSLTLTRRITGLLSAIRYVREGEYNYRIPVSGKDELAELGEEFNGLTRRLQTTEEVRRRFVADASHELKTPLASIRLLTDSILQNGDMDKDTVLEFVSDIGEEAWRLTRTTEKLQTLTRIDNDAPTERAIIDVGEIVSSVVKLVRPISDSRGILIYCDLWNDCTLYGTEEGVYQIVQNLVENAVKYNVDNGSVDVSLKRGGNSIMLTVEDTGIGIPDEDIPHVFDRFYRVDKARSREAGGSGLGLSIARSVTEELGGTISAEKRAGGGMRFTVTLPFADMPPETADTERNTAMEEV